MKRSQIVFVTVVFTALVTGLFVERAHTSDPFDEPSLLPPRATLLDRLEPRRGSHVLGGRIVDAEGRPVEGVLIHLRPTETGTNERADTEKQRESTDSAREESPERTAVRPLNEDEPRGTEVRPDARPIAWAVSDLDGGFRIDGLLAGDYIARLLQVEREVAREPVRLPCDDVVWTLGAPRPALEVLPELRRVRLEGRVARPTGEPLAGLEVVLRPVRPMAELDGGVVRRTFTDARGRYAFDQLAAVPYRAQLLPDWASGGTWPVLLSEALDLSDAGRPLDLTDPKGPQDQGEPPGVSHAFTFDPGELRGLLLDPSLRPVEGALIQAWPSARPNELWPPVTTAPDGTFVLRGLPPELFTVRIRAGAAVLQREVNVLAGISLDLDLEPILPGRRDDGG